MAKWKHFHAPQRGRRPARHGTAWPLAREGRRVVLAERSTPTHLWRSAGQQDWTADADHAAAGLWRELERATGAALLQLPGPRVRADEASAALTAAAIGAGVLLRSSDSVRAVEVVDGGVRVRTRGCVTTTRRVVLAGCGPQALAPGLPEPEFAGRTGPLVLARGVRSFAVPLLAAAVAELAGGAVTRPGGWTRRGSPLYVPSRSRAPASSPGSLAGNPPPRWGAPGDDLAAVPTRRQARTRPPAPGP